MAIHTSTPRKLFIPTPTGLHAAVMCDIYYRFDVPDEWEGRATLKDQAYVVWQFSPDLGLTKWQEKEVPFWATGRYNVTPIRYREGGEDAVDHKQYKVDVMRDPTLAVEPAFDANGDLEMFLGTRHALYKAFLGWGGEDFKRTVEAGSLSFERLIKEHAQFQILISHSEKDKHGQTWPRIQSLAPPTEGQALTPVDYERMKDRQPNVEEKEESLPF